MMDYKEYGGALFLGVKKPVVKAHASMLFRKALKERFCEWRLNSYYIKRRRKLWQ